MGSRKIALGITSALILLTQGILFNSSAHAATASPIRCQSTEAVGHAPINVPPPTGKSTSIRSIILITNCGKIAIAVDPKKTPYAILAMSAFAKAGYFDQTLCNQVSARNPFWVMCGDPTATGEGGPSFELPTESLPSEGPNNYPAGTVGLFNSDLIPNGSIFFIVYKDSTMKSRYSIWGRVVKGMDIVNYVAKAGSDESGTPNQPLAIIKVTAR
mgnify:CR=1 FL=1